jgi:predicted histidine transporter YuiF (NhaC family)
MRALSGAIITSGALVGLGLTALGYGIRFHGFGPEAINSNSHQMFGIPTLLLILVLLVIAMVIGVAIAFIGLAYHHERRYYEIQQAKGTGTPSHIVTP